MNLGKIILFIGLQASGKSTESRRRSAADKNVMRVSRDDIRNMLFVHWAGKKESVVSHIEKATVRAAVSAGYDIIIDDTNLNPGVRVSWQSLADELGVPLVEESFETPLETCIFRDANRHGNAFLGRPVIERTALWYGKLPPLPADQPVAIFDIDGTIANSDHRSYLVDGSQKKDHEKYFTLVGLDTPIQVVIDWANACYAAGMTVLLVSGRPTGRPGIDTVNWLAKHNVHYHHIFTRNGGDYRLDDIVKQEILDKLLIWIRKDQIQFCVDDRPRVIRMWKANGLKVYDVGHGIKF